MDIECQLADGSPTQSSGQVIHCKERVGVYCRNREQAGDKNVCMDYRFRFLCSSIEKPGEFIMSIWCNPVQPRSHKDLTYLNLFYYNDPMMAVCLSIKA